MCLAIPLKITDIDGKSGLGEIDGVKRKVRLDLISDIKVGDYVIVHAGVAIEKMDEKQALENLKLIKETFDALEGI